MSRRIETESDLESGFELLLKLDPRLVEVFKVAGRPPLRKRDGGFLGLSRIVVSQQLSVASAAAIWKRVEQSFDPFHHETVLIARAPKFKRAGLSRPKIKTFREVARAVKDGDLNLEALHDMPADEAHAAMTKIKGIGPWTADIYLLFCLGNADAWPAGDLAVQEAIRLAFGLKKRPDAKAMAKLAEKWRPWRGVAAHLFWAYYHVVKRREGAPVQATWPAVTKKQKAQKKNGAAGGK